MIYIDVTDIVKYARTNKHVSGIQRVNLNIARVLVKENTGRMIFFDYGLNQWREIIEFNISAEDDLNSFLVFTNDWRITKIKFGAIKSRITRGKVFDRIKYIKQYILSNLLYNFIKRRTKNASVIEFKFNELTKKDSIVISAIPYDNNNYENILSHTKAKIVFFFHDIIPLVRPEFCLEEERTYFKEYINLINKYSDVLITSAVNNILDYKKYCEKIGFDYSKKELAAIGLPADIVTSNKNPELKNISPIILRQKYYKYCLAVGSIGPRKNHFELLQAWKKFYESDVYDNELLIVAGASWERAKDIVHLLNSGFCGGSVLFIDSPNDSELAYLYNNCKFTINISLYEGWGLPISESIAYNKPTIVADNSSLIEASQGVAIVWENRSLKELVMIIARLFNDINYYKSKIPREQTASIKITKWCDYVNKIKNIIN